MASYQFRPMSAGDLPLVREWLALPHVTEWWGDPDEQFGAAARPFSSLAEMVPSLAEALQTWAPEELTGSAWLAIEALAFGASNVDQTRSVVQLVVEVDTESCSVVPAHRVHRLRVGDRPAQVGVVLDAGGSAGMRPPVGLAEEVQEEGGRHLVLSQARTEQMEDGLEIAPALTGVSVSSSDNPRKRRRRR